MEALRPADSLPFVWGQARRLAVALRLATLPGLAAAVSFPGRAAAGPGIGAGTAGAGGVRPAGARVVAGHPPGEFRIEFGDHGPDPGKPVLEACVRPRALRRPGIGSQLVDRPADLGQLLACCRTHPRTVGGGDGLRPPISRSADAARWAVHDRGISGGPGIRILRRQPPGRPAARLRRRRQPGSSGYAGTPSPGPRPHGKEPLMMVIMKLGAASRRPGAWRAGRAGLAGRCGAPAFRRH